MPMNECTNTEVRDLLPLLASGGQVESATQVEGHIAGCESCRGELAVLKAARQALLRAPVIDAARIARAVPAYRRTPATDPRIIPIDSRRKPVPAWRIAAAAAILLAAGTAVTVRQAGDDPRTAPAVTFHDSAGSIIRGTVGPLVGSDPAGPLPGSAALTSVPRTEVSTQMTFGGGLDDLTEEELFALLAALDEGESLTPVEPEEDLPSMSMDGEEES